MRTVRFAAMQATGPLVQHAAHHNFERLLAGGVRLFEYLFNEQL
ncbi:MAG TPA: hypothetical protein VMN83_14430 [Albitalea sp.]|nr:hypothetical protein [Albitalea sp.]